MLISIIIIFYTLIFVFDFWSIKSKQNKKENILYLLLFFLCFFLSLIDVSNLPVPKLSGILRNIIGK